MSPFQQQWNALVTIVIKEVVRFTRIWIQTILPPVITMTLYYVVFGSLIGRQIGDMDGFRYIDYIIPGLIMMSVITNSYANVVSSFFGAKYFGHIEEMMISPVSTNVMILGFVLGGVARGFLVGLLVTFVSLFFTDLHIEHVGMTLVIIFLTAFVFALAGLINGVFAKSFDAMNIVPIFVLTPLTYLGGVFYSISMLTPFWQTVSHANPILYMVNGFRYAILGKSDISAPTAIAILLVFTALLYGLAWYVIHKGYGIRK